MHGKRSLTEKEIIDHVKSLPIKDGFTKLKDEFVFDLNIVDVWYNFFGNNAPFALDFGIEPTGTELIGMTDWQDSEVQQLSNGDHIIKTRIVHTRTHMPPIVAATIAEYIPTERNSYLTEMGHEGFALEDYNRGYDFPFAESFLNVFRIEVF